MDQEKEVLLVVEDKWAVRDLLKKALEAPSREVLTAATGDEARALLKCHTPSVLLLDIGLPDASGLDLLAESLKEDSSRMIIMLTGLADEKMVVNAMRQGAMDYVTKPFSVAHVQAQIGKAFELTRRNRAAQDQASEVVKQTSADVERYLIGRSPAMIELFKLVGRLADSAIPVMITGESGTGKELVARALHRYGPNAKGPFVPVDCGSLPEGLLEAELFGYERGAFTGAVAAKPGRFELANGGTLFLDEIGNIPLELQAKLLRVLQEKTTQRLGANRSIVWDARLISATNVNVNDMVAQGKFREDLLYRIVGMELKVPPLRKRLEDLPLLLSHFFGKWDAGRKRVVVSDEALEIMKSYHWPGNVRELEHVVDRAATLTRGSVIGREDLPEELCGVRELSELGVSRSAGSSGLLPLEELNRRYARHALSVCNGNKMQAARALRIDRRTLISLLAEP